MAVCRKAIESGRICSDWLDNEYFIPAEEPAYAIILNPRKDSNARNFVNETVLFYQKPFNHLYPNLATDKNSQRAFDIDVADQEPGGRVIYQTLRRRQFASSSKTKK
ncbi:MAG: hypothetical protein ABSE17_02130 [Candidatus Levyibacteriota bacterium]|jgi:hypothetical protein